MNITSISVGMAAGTGRAAAVYLHDMDCEPTPSASSTAVAPVSGDSLDKPSLVPQPPIAPSSGRPQPRKQTSDDALATEDWLPLFRAAKQRSGSNADDELLVQCSSIASQVAQKVSQLLEAGNKAGLSHSDVASILRSKLLDNIAQPASLLNPQDAEKGGASEEEPPPSMQAPARPTFTKRLSFIGLNMDMGTLETTSKVQEEGVIVEVLTTKHAYLKDSSRKSLEALKTLAANLHEALVDRKGDLTFLKEVLQGLPVECKVLSALLDTSLPTPLVYAIVTLRNASVVKLLISFGAEVRTPFSAPRDWESFKVGMTPLEFVSQHPEDASFIEIKKVLEAHVEGLGEKNKEKSSRQNTMKRTFSWTSKGTQKLVIDASPAERGAADSKELEVAGISDANRTKSMTPRRRHSHGTTEPPTLEVSISLPQALGNGQLMIYKHHAGSPKEVYDLDVQVGEGTFGSVRKAKHKKTGQTHALKSCPKRLIAPEELWAEIEIMKQVDHPHIMRLYYTFEDDVSIYLASEMCEGGELFDALVRAGVLTESVASTLFTQILSAVTYLHASSICHRDLKPENFLLSKKGDMKDAKVKMIDFGTAKRFDLAPMTTKVCTVHYVAPEVLKKSQDPYTEKVDIWSCGVILFLMLCGQPPFHSDDDKELLKLVKKGKWEFKPQKAWKSVSDEAKQLISFLLRLKVEERYSASEARNHVWCNTQADNDRATIDEGTLTQIRTFVAQSRLKKVALQIIARQVSDDTIEELRHLFMSVDTDNSGSLTMEEMNEALLQLKVADDVRLEMVRLMSEIDVDRSGSINYTEFIAATISKQEYLKEEVCKAAFHVFDVDGDGVISKRDLVTLLSSGHDDNEGYAGINVEEVNDIMKEVDANGDGQMSFEEFMQLMADKSGDLGEMVLKRKSIASAESSAR